MPKTFKNISLWQPGGLFGWGGPWLRQPGNLREIRGFPSSPRDEFGFVVYVKIKKVGNYTLNSYLYYLNN